MAPIATTAATDAKPANPGAPTPYQAIRRHCLACSGGSSHEVTLCVSVRCPLYLFRFGHGPDAAEVASVARVETHPTESPMTQAEIASGSRLKAIRRKCLDCSGNNIAEVRRCGHASCDLHRFRMGKGNRVLTAEQRAAATERLARHRASAANLHLPAAIPAQRANSEECAGSR
jgi:hypothetical protein